MNYKAAYMFKECEQNDEMFEDAVYYGCPIVEMPLSYTKSTPTHLVITDKHELFEHALKADNFNDVTNAIEELKQHLQNGTEDYERTEDLYNLLISYVDEFNPNDTENMNTLTTVIASYMNKRT